MVLQVREQIAIQDGSAASHAVTKGQLDTGVADAKNRANHTGTQTSATISDFTTAVNALIAAVIDGAPGALDTLNELAAALGDDPNFAATTATALSDLDARLDTLEGSPSGGRSATFLVGDGAASSFTVNHAWALADKNKVHVEVVEVASGETILCKVVRTDVNHVTVSTGSYVPTANQYRVLLSEVLG